MDFIHVFCQKNAVASIEHSVVRTSREVYPFPWPWVIVRHLHKHGPLIQQFIKRDVLSRYRGSVFGIFWSLLRPLCMLAVYTVVFGYIFESKLGHPHENKLDFTLALFCGLVLFEFFAECLSRAPTLILSNSNYVTKVIFPLEILPISITGAALVQLLISLIPLLIGIVAVHRFVPLTALYLPLLLLPLILFCLGISWLLAALGVFIRDITSLVPVLVLIGMYASAVFYSIQNVPANLLPIVSFNPIAITIEQSRNAVLWGLPPVWSQYGWSLFAGIVVLVIGYAFFMRTKNAFADVV